MKNLFTALLIVLSFTCTAQQTEVGLLTGVQGSLLRDRITVDCVLGRSWHLESLRIESSASLGVYLPFEDGSRFRGSLRGGFGLLMGNAYVVPGISFTQDYRGGMGLYLTLGAKLKKGHIRVVSEYDQFQRYSFSAGYFITIK